MSDENSYEITVGEGDATTTINLTDLTDDGKSVIKKFSNDNWRDMVSEEYGTDASTTNFKSFDDLAKSYIHTKKAMGSKISMPNEDSSDEEWNDFYSRIGRPETADGYELGIDDEYAKYLDNDNAKEKYANIEKEFKKQMHELGITTKAANKLWLNNQKQYITSQTAQQKAMKDSIDNEWKSWRSETGDEKVDGQVKLANSVVASFLDEDGLKWAKESGMLKNTRIVKFLAKIGESMSEDKLKVKPTTPKEMVGREARAEANRLFSDKSHPMYDAFNTRNHPDHDKALKLYSELMNK